MTKNITIGILIIAVIVLACFLGFRHSTVPAVLPVTSPATTSTPATPTPTPATSPVSVNGMTKYTDASFGFSFWYPTTWQLIASPQNVPFGATINNATVVQRFALQAPGQNSPDILIQEAHSTTRTITDTGGAGPIGPITYFFDASSHLWMVTSAETGVTKAADISNNTMGGLHIFAGTSRFNTEIVPLSADNFVVVGNSGGADSNSLTKTIVALDPSVATPVSAAEQAQTVDAEYGDLIGNPNMMN